MRKHQLKPLLFSALAPGLLTPHFSDLDCGPYRDPSGGRIAMHAGVFCTAEDDQTNYQSPDTLLAKLLNTIQAPEHKAFWVASLDLSEPKIIAAFCQRLKAGGTTLRLMMQNGPNAVLAQQLSQCSRSQSRFFFQPVEAKQNGLSTFNPKLMLVNPRKSSGQIWFGSTNLTSGTYLKHENLNTLKLPTRHPLYQQHICAYETLFHKYNNRSEFYPFYQACSAQIAASNDLPIQFFLVPGEGEKALQVLAEKMVYAKKIVLASHRLSLEPLIYSLKKFLKRGGQLTIYADGGYVENFYHQTSAQSENESLALLELVGLGANVIPVYTNQPHGSYFHHKVLVMDQAYANAPDMVLLGSANFTHAGFLNRWFLENKSRWGHLQFSSKTTPGVNMETIYLVQDQAFAQAYRDYFRQFNQTQPTTRLKTPLIRKGTGLKAEEKEVYLWIRAKIWWNSSLFT